MKIEIYCYITWPQDTLYQLYPYCKIHVANMGPTWVLSAPDGPIVAPCTLLSGITWQNGAGDAKISNNVWLVFVDVLTFLCPDLDDSLASIFVFKGVSGMFAGNNAHCIKSVLNQRVSF